MAIDGGTLVIKLATIFKEEILILIRINSFDACMINMEEFKHVRNIFR